MAGITSLYHLNSPLAIEIAKWGQSNQSANSKNDLSPHRDSLKGQASSIYIIVEHKSYHDPLVFLQLLRFMVQTWERDRSHKGKKIATSFRSLFPKDTPEFLLDYIPSFQTHIFNLTSLPDEAIHGSPAQEAQLLAMKYARTSFIKAIQYFDYHSEVWGEQFFTTPLFKNIVSHLMNASAEPSAAIIDYLNEPTPKAPLRYPPIAHTLHQQRSEGLIGAFPIPALIKPGSAP